MGAERRLTKARVCLGFMRVDAQFRPAYRRVLAVVGPWGSARGLVLALIQPERRVFVAHQGDVGDDAVDPAVDAEDAGRTGRAGSCRVISRKKPAMTTSKPRSEIAAVRW